MNWRKAKQECGICGEDDPIKFDTGVKTKCRTCKILDLRLNSAKKRSVKKHLDFDIDLDYLRELLVKQDSRCIYTGIKFNSNNKYYSLSIDRKDSKKGYTKENVQLVCTAINLMKLDTPEEIFLQMINSIQTK